jgi:hypothetical protein
VTLHLLVQSWGTELQLRAHKWYNSRPASLGGPPIFIYEEVFSDFVRNMQEHEPTSQELDAAYEFVDRALNLYQQEKARLNTLKEDMCKLMGMSEIEQEFQFNVSFKPDGARTCVERTHLPPFSGLLELMNEIGEEGCDPASQAECDYAAVFLSDKVPWTPRCITIILTSTCLGYPHSPEVPLSGLSRSNGWPPHQCQRCRIH